jgi:hypothetical protein
MRDGLRGQELTIMDFNVIRLSFLLLIKHKKPRVCGVLKRMAWRDHKHKSLGI